jgi:hypothetical protein
MSLNQLLSDNPPPWCKLNLKSVNYGFDAAMITSSDYIITGTDNGKLLVFESSGTKYFGRAPAGTLVHISNGCGAQFACNFLRASDNYTEYLNYPSDTGFTLDQGRIRDIYYISETEILSTE